MSSSSSEHDTTLMSFYLESLLITYEEIASATDNFTDKNLILQNTFYKVYKGQLSDSGELIDIVARKCLQDTVALNEVTMSIDIKHKNIVSIFKLAFSVDGKAIFIINKHEANESLEKHLSGSTLTWIQRLHICVCIADALRYIHNLEDDESVIHGNIKSSHILLDHNWEPKLKGFGFANRVKKHHLHLTSRYNGSLEYMDPEYERTGGLTHKSDVFSFGVVLFEVLFGRKAEGDNWYFARLARSHYEAGTLDAMINSDLRKQMNGHSLKIFSETAYICLNEEGAPRPDMDQIFKTLQEALKLQQMHESYVTSSNRLKEKNIDHLRIPLSDIESATNNFSTNCIGSGGFGTVYKAELDIFDDTISSVPEGKNKGDFPKKRTTVAVKRLKRIQGEVAGFFTEIEMLTNCKHPNTVSLLGICEEGPERILVYEHVSNGSLCDYFEKINNTKRLSWAQRLQICLDIAHGLDYLHSCTEEKPMIIHRDIKSDNILLDNSWVAKIADFGLSRLRPVNQTANTINTGTIAGTNLYLDPEYLETGTLRKESDIYSFGVVLFEVVSGKLAHDQSYSIKNERGLLSIVQKCFNEGTLKNVIDPNLKDPFVGTLILDDGLDKKSLDIFFDIAYKCLAPKQAQRPTMKVIINQLETALEFQENKKDCFHISLEDLTSATKNFSDDKCIGKGRYWKQYEGHILVANRLTTVIVKRWDKNSSQARHEYMTELKVLFERKHENIVALLGHCNESRERIIVYEHATYGSLDKHLEDMSLTWLKRLKICVGIASGLKFLHEDADMIHRDIKSSSILLDTDWEPKICNFELSSKSIECLKVEHATDNAYGSLGYLDPLHEKKGYFDERSDVYSLGVILMEILCGRLAWGEGCKDHSESLGPLAKRRFKKEKLDELVFESIKEQSSPQSFTTFASIAAQCLSRYWRPNASEVVIRLERALELQEKNIDHLRIPLSDIESATNNFSTNCIGSGGFGTVYKAELDIFDDTISSVPEGKNKGDFPKKRTTVAVKRLKRIQGEVAGFFTEIEMLTNCKHPNTVSLLGICEEGPERILVYEHVSNGSLCDYFEKINNTKRLSWAQRLQICLDIAHGLDYLHSCTEEKPMIIHRDIKSDNILLDNSWVAKIADFGLSRLRPVNQTANTINTGTIAGTNLYLDPEYLETGTLRKESDIYSFGVVLFEVVSGKLAHDQSYSIKNERGLLSIVQKCFNEGTLKNVIDPNLKDPFVGTLILDDGLDKKSLDIFFDIAYKCLAPKQAQRPTMKVIINQLETALEFQENKKDCFHISLEDLTSATKNFSDDKCIGKGRYWKQYEGHILVANRLTTVIVKRWDKNSSQARHEYMTELKVLFERKHENIVALLGHCNESRERIIVYEHATYGSLDKHLEDMSLTWLKRLKICVGIASGLKFLHEDADMIHRDIKSSSILLDTDWEPKICNFELSSKSIECLKVEHATDNAYGSLGYLDPLHEKKGYFDERSDVYSLGVILMEILCGRLAWGEGCKDHSESLGPLAKRRFKKEKLDELVFESIKEQSSPQSFTTFASIAAQCLSRYWRPNASEVVIRLERALELQERSEKLRISLEDIKLGTENFSEAKFIGEGTYWKQYKGDIPLANGLTTVVIKRFDTNCDEGSNKFIVESRALLEYEHKNIIRLAGYCDEVNEKIIVYEHASNGRLTEHLKDTSLTWLKRLKICIDVATGLQFLHEDVMIHRGIKSGSILIDGEWKAIISNLELVTNLVWPYGVDSESDESEEQEESELEKTYAYSSVGYIDPKCKDRDEMTRASDIYSLGVVLMEILCGRLSWEEGCKDPSECYLVPLAKRRYEEGNLDELVFEGIKNQIHNKSLTTFINIVIWCLDYIGLFSPDAPDVIIELQKALEYQEDYETWEPKLPKDYEEILHFSKINKLEKFKDIYDILCKGFRLREKEVYFSLGTNGAKNYVISATKFSYKYRCSQNWQRIPQSRFKKVAKMSTSWNLNIHIKMRTPRLSMNVNYAVHLVFKFCGKSSAKSVYVNLTYKMGSETFHAYFAIWKDKDWMKIELCRFLNHKEYTNFEIVLEGFARNYCANEAIYVEGIEFEAIDYAKQEEIEETMDVQNQLPTVSDNRSGNRDEGGKVFSLNKVNEKKHFILPSMEVIHDSSDVKRFRLIPSAAMPRFQEVIELLPQQVFGIKCKIESQMLSPDTNYMCYLAFKLSENCQGLHCPVRVRNVLQWKNKEIGLVCFRLPNQWNSHDTYWVPKMREDGLMEVMVWKFNSTYALRNDRIPMHLKLITYEGTMSGLIVCSLEIRPMQEYM